MRKKQQKTNSRLFVLNHKELFRLRCFFIPLSDKTYHPDGTLLVKVSHIYFSPKQTLKKELV